MSWTFDSTVVTMDSEEYTMDGSEPVDNSFTTKVYLTQQRLVVANGARIVIAKEDN